MRLRHRSMMFFDEDEMPYLLEVLLAANYLNSGVIVDAIASIIASRISGKSREDMREILGIEHDFTPEEEDAIIAEHAWAFA